MFLTKYNETCPIVCDSLQLKLFLVVTNSSTKRFRSRMLLLIMRTVLPEDPTNEGSHFFPMKLSVNLDGKPKLDDGDTYPELRPYTIFCWSNSAYQHGTAKTSTHTYHKND